VIQTVKGIVRTALHSSGAISVVRGLNRRALRILMYHNFSPDNAGLAAQCEHIRRYYQPLSLSSLAESLEMGRPLPHNNLVITIDDGYRDFFLYAYPVFRHYRISPTVFVISEFLDQKSWLWWNQIEYAFQLTSEKALSLEWPSGAVQNFSFNTPDHRLRVSNEIVDTLLRIENSERLKLIDVIVKKLGVALPPLPPFKWSPLEWSEVREMAQNGIEFGAHTRTHPILSRINDTDTIRDEIEGSKLRLEEELDKEVLHFSYPNGKVADLNKQIVDLVKQCGFRTAVTSERGLNFSDADPFLLRRIGVEPVGATYYFQELLAGIVDAPGAKTRYSSLN